MLDGMIAADGRFMRAVGIVLEHEGGLVDDPQDHGGITNYGISLRYLEGLGHIKGGDGYLLGDLDHDGEVGPDDIRKMSRDQAIGLYYSQWWERYGYAKIQGDALAFKVFDLAVTMGAGRANRMLQEAVHEACFHPSECRILIDGILGPLSMRCINDCANNIEALDYFKKRAEDFYRSLNQPRFEAGWLRRVMD